MADVITNVSEEYIASNIRVEAISELETTSVLTRATQASLQAESILTEGNSGI
jgi:hypothetical protein